MKVEGHVQTLRRREERDRSRHLVDRAFRPALNEEMHKLMAQKGIWRAGTETPDTGSRATGVAAGLSADGRGPEERVRRTKCR